MANVTPHWAGKYIGTRWEAGAQGPAAFDCWGLVRYVQAVHFGVYLPIILPENYRGIGLAREFRDTPEREHWCAVDKACEGDLVELSRANKPHHIGVWIDADGGGVLHCLTGAGVVFDSMASLRLQHWNVVSILRRKTDV